MKLTFLGAARTVTGSKHLITTATGKKILLDCGLFQNKGSDNDMLNRHFGVDPASVDFLVLSHAHIDHSGNIPHFVKEGFSGPVFCTPATRDLCAIMLTDSARIQESDTEFLNKRRAQKNMAPLKPLYTVADVETAMSHFITIPYNTKTNLDNNISLTFTNVGHIPGSGVVNLEIQEDDRKIRLAYTGDIGRPHDKILKAPEPFPQADYIICESTYGNRLHDTSEDSEEKLRKIVAETCVVKKGKLIVPAFSLGRTQEIVYALNRLKNAGKLPPLRVFVDSPLAVNATAIMRAHPECFNANLRKYMQNDPDPFGFNGLEYIQNVTQSKELNFYKEPCIIISASGMMEAGRIKHHLKNNIEDEKNTVLIVGYCTPESLGGKLREGAKKVKIFGEEFNVRALVEIMDSYSAHADYQEMLQFLSCQNKQQVKKIFLVHGQPEAQLSFSDKLVKAGFADVETPGMSMTCEIF